MVVIGPPMSGVTTLANKLCKKTGLPVYTIDEVLLEVANTASEISAMVRLCCNVASEKERQEHAAKLAAAQQASEGMYVLNEPSEYINIAVVCMYVCMCVLKYLYTLLI